MVASFRASSCWILAKSTLLPLIVLVVFVLRCEYVSGHKTRWFSQPLDWDNQSDFFHLLTRRRDSAAIVRAFPHRKLHGSRGICVATEDGLFALPESSLHVHMHDLHRDSPSVERSSMLKVLMLLAF